MLMPPHAFGVVLWSGNELKETRGTITNVRECKQRSCIAAQVAKDLRESCFFVAGDHTDVSGMPPEFDAHLADIRLSLDIADSHKADSWHTRCFNLEQWTLCYANSSCSP